MQVSFKLPCGASKFDRMLGGWFASCSIPEMNGEFRCGKTQVCHSLALMAQLPPNLGGADGKGIYIDTEGRFRPERIRQIAEAKGVSAEAANGQHRLCSLLHFGALGPAPCEERLFLVG